MLKVFQDWVRSKWRYNPEPLPANQADLACAALGYVGEAGELADYIKKVLFQGKPFDRDKFVEEAGDGFYYLVMLCTLVGVDFEEVMHANWNKLDQRYVKALTFEESENRAA